MITERDKRIIDLLREQDICFYKDITKKFFPSEVAACPDFDTTLCNK